MNPFYFIVIPSVASNINLINRDKLVKYSKYILVNVSEDFLEFVDFSGIYEKRHTDHENFPFYKKIDTQKYLKS